MNEHTDTDFLALSEKVTEGFAANTLEHAKLCAMAEENAQRAEKLDAILAEVTTFNRSISTKLFGNGNVGCMETQRNHDSFLRGIKKILWVFGSVSTAALVSGIIVIAKHILSS